MEYAIVVPVRIEMVVDSACRLGEGPIWHAGEQVLYWADIPLGRLHRFDPETGGNDIVLEDRLLGAIVVQGDGSLLLLRDSGNVVCLRNGRLETVIDSIPGAAAFNDAVADPRGRVFSGTCAVGRQGMPEEYDRYGCLYRIDTNGTYAVVDEGMVCSNGLGFSPDKKKMYFTDSGPCSIYVYDYEEETGEVSNRRVFAVTEDPVKPDGMTVDSDGCVWSARWAGGCVIRYSPLGAEHIRIDLPTDLVTSVMFGGRRFNDLYVTTAGGDGSTRSGSAAGSLFRITGLGVRGVPEFTSRVRTAKCSKGY